LKIQFELRNIDSIVPWGENGSRRLHWFGLSDGCFCIDTPAGRLLEHSGPEDPDLGRPWCEYQVVRLFEDLVTAWPVVSEPIPSDVIKRHTVWNACKGRVIDDEIAEEVGFWWSERRVDFSYLQPAPELTLWRVGLDVHVKWAATAPWSPATADLTLPYNSVREAIAAFFDDFLAQMAVRVAEIEHHGWRREDCEVDVPGLVREQQQRMDEAKSALAMSRPTDWNLVRRRLDQIGA
jgi:hypothetical protein